MARTGSSTYLQYDYESTFGGGGNSLNKVFGLEQKISSLTWKNNQIALGQLNSPEIKAFAYGKNEGSCSVEFVVSNPWFFDWVFTTPVTAGGGPYTHTWDSDPSTDTGIKDPITGHLEIGFQGQTANVVRNAKGVIAKTLSLKTTINDVVKGTMDMAWGKEDAVGTSLDSTPATDDIAFPYTFSHATLELIDGTVVAQLQDFNIEFNTNADLIWGIGSADAVAAARKIFEITGKFNASYVDSTQLARVVNRTELATLQITLTNGLAGTNERSIVINGAGVGPSEHVNPNIAPGEIVFEDLSWQIRSVDVVATNNTSAAP